MSELRLANANFTPDQIFVDYDTDGLLHVSFPSFHWVGTAEEAGLIIKTLVDKWAEADVHALLLKGLLPKGAK